MWAGDEEKWVRRVPLCTAPWYPKCLFTEQRNIEILECFRDQAHLSLFQPRGWLSLYARFACLRHRADDQEAGYVTNVVFHLVTCLLSWFSAC